MGEILGIGITHYPGLISPDEDRAFPLTRTLLSDRIPSEVKDPATWPEAMRTEYGDDQGIAAARMHRDRLVAGFRQQRAELDAFNPDFVLIWGDDQYENFKEDIIPPFCVLAYDDIQCPAHDEPRRQPSPQRVERAGGQGLPVQRPPRREVLGVRAHQPRNRHVLRLQAAARKGRLGTRHHQHPALLGLRPQGFRLPGGAFPRQLLRQQGDTQPGRRLRVRKGRRPARPFSQAVHGGRRGHRPRLERQSLASGIDRLLQLVPCLPHSKEQPVVAGPRVGPGAVRRAEERRLRGLGATSRPPR